MKSVLKKCFKIYKYIQFFKSKNKSSNKYEQTEIAL